MKATVVEMDSLKRMLEDRILLERSMAELDALKTELQHWRTFTAELLKKIPDKVVSPVKEGDLRP